MRYPSSRSAAKAIACFAMLLVGTRSVLAASLDEYPFPPPEPQRPISGSGSGGAWGPSEIDLKALPQADPEVTARQPPAPPPWVDLDLPTPPPPKRLVFEDAATVTVVDESELFADDDETSLETVAPSDGFESLASVTSSFTDFGRVDVNGASDGTRLVTVNGDSDGQLDVYSIGGVKISSVAIRDIFCAGSNPLPACSFFDSRFVDPRVSYDTLSQRWTFVTLVVRDLTPAGQYVVQNAFVVSQSSDPTGSYYRYQYPACGAFDNWDRSDQPRIGFNNQWIVITSACQVKPGSQNPNDNGAGLAVFLARASRPQPKRGA